MSKAACQGYVVLLHVSPWWHHQQLTKLPSQHSGYEKQLDECSHLTCAPFATLLAVIACFLTIMLLSRSKECLETPDDAEDSLSREELGEETRNESDKNPEVCGAYVAACKPNGSCLGMTSPHRKNCVRYSSAMCDALQRAAGSTGSDTSPVVSAAAAIIEQLVRGQPESVTCLSDQPPFCTFRCCMQTELMGTGDYLMRVSKYLKCSDECFLMGFIYLDRLLTLNRNLVIPSRCIHRIMLTCIVVASKFHEDCRYSNMYYARVGGLTRSELLSAEIELLKMIKWELCVAPAELDQYREDVLHVLRVA